MLATLDRPRPSRAPSTDAAYTSRSLARSGAPWSPREPLLARRSSPEPDTGPDVRDWASRDLRNCSGLQRLSTPCRAIAARQLRVLRGAYRTRTGKPLPALDRETSGYSFPTARLDDVLDGAHRDPASGRPPLRVLTPDVEVRGAPLTSCLQDRRPPPRGRSFGSTSATACARSSRTLQDRSAEHLHARLGRNARGEHVDAG